MHNQDERRFECTTALYQASLHIQFMSAENPIFTFNIRFRHHQDSRAPRSISQCKEKNKAMRKRDIKTAATKRESKLSCARTTRETLVGFLSRFARVLLYSSAFSCVSNFIFSFLSQLQCVYTRREGNELTRDARNFSFRAIHTHTNVYNKKRIKRAHS